MPGPRSPARKAKEKQAKEKLVNRNVESSYEPGQDSIVRTLPHEVTQAQRTWWDPYRGKDKDFHQYKDRRGGQQGAMAWLRDKYVTEWWDVHFPEAKGASDKD